MAELIRCTDPWSREIILTEDRWRDHILLHGELSGNALAVQRALETPTAVYHDIRNPNGENFYLFGVLPAPFDRTYLKVCVRFTPALDGHVRGEVVTAYATSTIKPGEVRQ